METKDGERRRWSMVERGRWPIKHSGERHGGVVALEQARGGGRHGGMVALERVQLCGPDGGAVNGDERR